MQVVFADVAQPDQARIVGLNAQYFLKNGGHFVISIKASCIDSTAPPEAVFARWVGSRCMFASLLVTRGMCSVLKMWLGEAAKVVNDRPQTCRTYSCTQACSTVAAPQGTWPFVSLSSRPGWPVSHVLCTPDLFPAVR
jgi:hypothetical protein